jgi:hypothetical protein
LKRLSLLCALALLAPPAAAALTPPPWLEQAARRAAAYLSDGTVPTSSTYLAPRSRFPRIVLTGSFVCNDCSRPVGAPATTGRIAELRFDGETRLSRDFALCKTRAQCDASLCSFGACTQTADALDAAFAALDARLRGFPGDPDPFSRRAGTFSCHIHYAVQAMRYIVGSCTTTLRFIGAHAAEVRLTERWRPREYEQGRWVRLPARTHSWRLLETDDGWKIAISSSGDSPPQLPKGVSR